MLRLILVFILTLSIGLFSCRQEICNCERSHKRPYKKVKIKYGKNGNGGYKKKGSKKLVSFEKGPRSEPFPYPNGILLH